MIKKKYMSSAGSRVRGLSNPLSEGQVVTFLWDDIGRVCLRVELSAGVSEEEVGAKVECPLTDSWWHIFEPLHPGQPTIP